MTKMRLQKQVNIPKLLELNSQSGDSAVFVATGCGQAGLGAGD